MPNRIVRIPSAKAKPHMTRPLRLVQITDTHLFRDQSEDLRGIATLPALRAVLRHAADAIAGADALLVTGDVVQDDAGGYVHFREAFAALGKPVLCIPGNHDDVPEMRRALAAPPFIMDPHVDIGGWRIVLLDSVKPGEASGALSDAALAALSQSLAGAGDRHVLVCLHHHPVDMQSRWLDTVGLDNPDDLFRILDAHTNVRALTWGHVHQAWEGERRGVRLLATPSTCTQFLPAADDFAIDTRPPAYRILELAAGGSIETGVVWLDRFAAEAASSSSSVG